MMNKMGKISRFFFRFLPVFVFALMPMGVLTAQSGSSLFFADISCAQRSWYNPGFIAPYEFSAAIPGVGGIHAQVDNNFFSWNRLFTRDSRDSLHLDPGRLLGNVGRNGRVLLTADAEILRFNWRRGRNNFCVGAYAHADFQGVFKKETLAFLLQGPGAHEGLNHIVGNRVDLNSYIGLYFGFSRQVSRKFSYGGRIKLLQGLWNLHSGNLDLTVDIRNSDMSDANPDIVPETYAIAMEGEVLTNLGFKRGSGTLGIGLEPLQVAVFKDIGAALDFGIAWKFAKNWELGVAVNDLGFIFWGDERAGSYCSHMDSAYFVFDGIAADRFNDNFDVLDFVQETLNAAIDSLDIRRQDAKNGYARALPAGFNISLSYTLNDKWCFGTAFKALIYDKYFAPELLVSCTWMPTRNFALCVSNTFTSGNLLNFGAAFVVNAGPLQLHLGIDRLHSFNVSAMRTVNINFGLNLVFGGHAYDFYTGR